MALSRRDRKNLLEADCGRFTAEPGEGADRLLPVREVTLNQMTGFAGTEPLGLRPGATGGM